MNELDELIDYGFLGPPRLLLTVSGTVHLLREDGKTYCGRELDGSPGWMWTSSESQKRCGPCVWFGGMKVTKPPVEYRCSECRALLTRTEHTGHYHFEAPEVP